MPSPKQHVLTIRIPHDLFRGFKELAYVKRKSMNEMAAKVLREAVERNPKARKKLNLEEEEIMEEGLSLADYDVED